MREIEVIVVVRERGQVVDSTSRTLRRDASADEIAAAIDTAPIAGPGRMDQPAEPAARVSRSSSTVTTPDPSRCGPADERPQRLAGSARGAGFRLTDLPPSRRSMWCSAVEDLAGVGRVWSGWADLSAEQMFEHPKTTIAVTRLAAVGHQWAAERVIEYGPLRVIDVCVQLRTWINNGQVIHNPAGAAEQMLRQGPPKESKQKEHRA